LRGAQRHTEHIAYRRWETGKVFGALEWLASMGSHVPNKAEQMLRYYGYYSNVSRGKRGKLNLDEAIPCILKNDALRLLRFSDFIR
jgi:hypothetical protein